MTNSDLVITVVILVGVVGFFVGLIIGFLAAAVGATYNDEKLEREHGTGNPREQG